VAVCRWQLYASLFLTAFDLSFLRPLTFALPCGTYLEMGWR
jgi:hypothetical protein